MMSRDLGRRARSRAAPKRPDLGGGLRDFTSEGRKETAKLAAERKATKAAKPALDLGKPKKVLEAIDRVEIKGSTWLQRASIRPLLTTIPRRASSVGLQLPSRPRTSKIG